MTNFTDTLTLIVHICAQRRSYSVTFPAGGDAIAAQFIRDRREGGVRALAETLAPITGGGWAIGEDDSDEAGHADLALWPQLTELLYPECEHGMSLANCFGPDHFMSAAQERERGW